MYNKSQELSFPQRVSKLMFNVSTTEMFVPLFLPASTTATDVMCESRISFSFNVFPAVFSVRTSTCRVNNAYEYLTTDVYPDVHFVFKNRQQFEMRLHFVYAVT